MQTLSDGKTPTGDSTAVVERPESLVPPEPGRAGGYLGSDTETTISSPRRLARIAGVLYLLVAIFGGFAQGFVYPKIYVVGDAAKTAGAVTPTLAHFLARARRCVADPARIA